MATITKIADKKYRAQVRRAGQRTVAKTFTADTDRKALEKARKWGTDIEAEIDSGKSAQPQGKTGITLARSILRFLDEQPDVNKGTVSALKSIARFMGDVMLSALTEENVVEYVESKDFSPASGAFHFSALRSMTKRARIVWKYEVPDIMTHTRERLRFDGLIGSSKKRERRPTEEELKKLTEFDYPNNFPMAAIINFAIATAMRRGEIVRIEKNTFSKNERTIIIKDRKHPTKKKGNHKIVPLLDSAVQIIEEQINRHEDEKIFPITSNYISEVFGQTCKRLGIVDLHFHDLRHEATSRLFEMGYQAHEVQMYTGHEDLNMLMRYTHLKAKDIRRIETEKAEQKPLTGAVGMDEETLKEFEQFLKMKKMMEMMKQQEAA